jgi:hypothetical protein
MPPSFIHYASPLPPPPDAKPKPKPKPGGPRPKPSGPVTTMAVGEEQAQHVLPPMQRESR